MKLSWSARAAVAGGAALLSLGTVAATGAHASTGEDNQMNPTACVSNVNSSFQFTLWYNSSYSGSWRNIGWSVLDFDDERVGGDAQAGTQPLKFCSNGAAGGGQGLKNNAASAQNRHSKSTANVYYNKNFRGKVDSLANRSSWFQLKETYNNNASFQWI
ncbi:hypothetical protein CFP65_3809 [Kitasatospora sp. MMS16-BH015]|uniref:peptidase inhibitor family I36 protein n=1 Tax=Kitasatospora sp. MMS16-BH015 TaxID=2018025 RepID=UPI000CA34F57|nr:peptidase inhibitor family I36 protein [Kitasatospora sp. MMS16-BH015]AUG78589.1 hypothetical protein CFP65_3809 [Kitasatospora sp. MMS16-BH015]